MESQKKERSELDIKYIWRLEDIFPSDSSWEDAYNRIPDSVAVVASFKGRLGESSAVLAEALRADQSLSMMVMELFTYARMRRDEDNSRSAYQEMTDRAMALFYQCSEATAFLMPEMAAINEDQLRQWVNDEPLLLESRHQILDSLRHRPHILSEAEEILLSKAGPMSEAIDVVYTMLDNVDIKLGHITDENGQTVELTPSLFSLCRENKDRRVRADAFAGVHAAYGALVNTMGALYNSRIKADLFYASARRHPSSLAAALFGDNLSESHYTNLIDTVKANLPTLYRYFDLRRKLLNLPDLHIYDTYIPITDLPNRRFTFEEACAVLSKGLAPLGEHYLSDLATLLSDRWIDVYETEGKTGGAYSWGSYQSHPYILLNFAGTLSDVFTLAHEVGHSMHSFYSNQRPYSQSQYPIFLAEIASTVNENILLRHLINQCDTSTIDGRKEKAYLLNHFLEEFRLTVFRQTMFAEFELVVHQRIEKGEALSADNICRIYSDLLRQYFGPDVIIDDYMRCEWTRIPHFYSPYYVYKYATGLSCAVALGSRIMQGSESVVTSYREFLGAGGSDYPLAILNRAGIDMTTTAPIEAAMVEFAATLAEFAAMID
jgi:oligoendopeptidase F